MTIANEPLVTEKMDEQPTPNLPLLRKVIDHIEAHPEEHNQDLWEGETSCGTQRCAAGWALYFDGQIVFKGNGFGSFEPVSDRAGEVLGLTIDERFDMFYMAGTTAAVRRVAERVAARAGERL